MQFIPDVLFSEEKKGREENAMNNIVLEIRNYTTNFGTTTYNSLPNCL